MKTIILVRSKVCLIALVIYMKSLESNRSGQNPNVLIEIK